MENMLTIFIYKTRARTEPSNSETYCEGGPERVTQ